MPVSEIARSVANGEISVGERVRSTLGRIEEAARLNAFTTVLGDAALEEAAAVDLRARRGDPLGPLAGSIVAVKDCFNVRGAAATVGSKVSWHGRMDVDAAVVAKLRAADAIILGKTNLDEWSFGAETSNPVFGRTLNPLDESSSPGGSSGGSAVAVAAGLADVGVGTDTGGSVRLPAAFCGVVGFKGRYDSIGRTGVQPLAAPFDTIGFLTRDPSDIAPILHAVTGRPSTPGVGLRPDRWHGCRIAILHDLGELSEVVTAGFKEHLSRLIALGCELVEIEMPNFADISSHFLNITLSELAEQHVFDMSLTDCGPTLREAVRKGASTQAIDYIRALRFCAELSHAYERSMDTAACDVLLTPSTPIERLAIGQRVVHWRSDVQEDALLAAVRYCLFVNMLGVGALSLPVTTRDGDQFGLQLVGRKGIPDLALPALARDYAYAVALN